MSSIVPGGEVPSDFSQLGKRLTNSSIGQVYVRCKACKIGGNPRDDSYVLKHLTEEDITRNAIRVLNVSEHGIMYKPAADKDEKFLGIHSGNELLDDGWVPVQKVRDLYQGFITNK